MYALHAVLVSASVTLAIPCVYVYSMWFKANIVE